MASPCYMRFSIATGGNVCCCTPWLAYNPQLTTFKELSANKKLISLYTSPPVSISISVSIIQHPSDRGFYCSALGVSDAGLVANAKQTPGSVSIVSCVYRFVGVS